MGAIGGDKQLSMNVIWVDSRIHLLDTGAKQECHGVPFSHLGYILCM